MRQRLSGALLQFKSFAIASNQRVQIHGLQEDKTRLVGGIVGMTTIGAFIHALEKLGAPSLHTGASALFPNASQEASASRYASRSIVGSFLGPTYELASDATSLAGLAATNAKGRSQATRPA